MHALSWRSLPDGPCQLSSCGPGPRRQATGVDAALHGLTAGSFVPDQRGRRLLDVSASLAGARGRNLDGLAHVRGGPARRHDGLGSRRRVPRVRWRPGDRGRRGCIWSPPVLLGGHHATAADVSNDAWTIYPPANAPRAAAAGDVWGCTRSEACASAATAATAASGHRSTSGGDRDIGGAWDDSEGGGTGPHHLR